MVLVKFVKVWDPEVPILPLQPPEAVQLLALVEDQVRVLDPPAMTEAGAALMLNVGGGGGGGVDDATVTLRLCVVDPPPPVHVRV